MFCIISAKLKLEIFSFVTFIKNQVFLLFYKQEVDASSPQMECFPGKALLLISIWKLHLKKKILLPLFKHNYNSMKNFDFYTSIRYNVKFFNNLSSTTDGYKMHDCSTCNLKMV